MARSPSGSFARPSAVRFRPCGNATCRVVSPCDGPKRLSVRQCTQLQSGFSFWIHFSKSSSSAGGRDDGPDTLAPAPACTRSPDSSSCFRFSDAGLLGPATVLSSTKPPVPPNATEESWCSKVFFRLSGQDFSAATERTRFLFAADRESVGLVVTTKENFGVSSSPSVSAFLGGILPVCQWL